MPGKDVESVPMNERDEMEHYLSIAISGSLVGQIAAKRDLDLDEFLDQDSPRLAAICTEIEELGIYPPLVARSMLLALVTLLSSEANLRIATEEYSKLLWSILGDPKTGGEDPPKIYLKAAQAMHLCQIGLLNPSIKL